MKKVERLDTKGKVLDNTTSVIILKQDEIIRALNEVIEKLTAPKTGGRR